MIFYKNKANSRGFTLVELIVVIAIIGLLTTIGISSYARVRLLARDAERHNDLNQMRLALELYYTDVKTYPQSACDSGNPTVAGWQTLSGAQGLTATINGDGPWVTLVPQDSLNNPTTSYVYKYCSDLTSEYMMSYKTEADGIVHLITKSGLVNQ